MDIYARDARNDWWLLLGVLLSGSGGMVGMDIERRHDMLRSVGHTNLERPGGARHHRPHTGKATKCGFVLGGGEMFAAFR